VVSLICVALAAVCWKDIGRLVRAPSVRCALWGFGFLSIWTGLLVAMIRCYSGAGWAGDWLEHLQRTLFFLHHFPADTAFVPLNYALPARPPMWNVLASFFLAQTAERFELFQVVFAFLNLLLFLPCCLLMPALSKRAKGRTWLLVLLFATSPVVMENATYAWTKAGAAFYVLLALGLYLAGWRKQDRIRTTAAFVALAAGLLAHYSAGPYVVVLTLHYLVRVFPKRQRKWRELAGIAALCGLLLGTWLFWSLAVYGEQITFASNTTVTFSQEYEGSTAGKMAANLLDTIVPIVMRDPALLEKYDQPNAAGQLRDNAFIFYQVNAIFGMGLAGGPLVIWLLYRALRRRRVEPAAQAPAPRAVRPAARGKRQIAKVPARITGALGSPGAPAVREFWLILIVCSALLGIMVVGERDPQGVGHLTLLSLQAMGLTLLAAAIPWQHRPLAIPLPAILLLAGCAVDCSLGVLLQARMENLENTAQTTVFPEMEFADGAIQTAAPGPSALSRSAWRNWYGKHMFAINSKWLEQLGKRYGNDPSIQGILSQMADRVASVRSDDATMWQGWFGRHGGEAVFLGDHLPGWGANAATAMLAMMVLGLAVRVTLRTG
jgi:hypothetical protein